MAQHSFNQFGSGHNPGSIDPNDLSMGGGYPPSFNNNNNFNANSSGNTNGFSSGSALFGDDELLDGLGSPSDNQPQDFSSLNMGFSQGGFVQSRMNGYSNTPDGDPIQSPYATGFNNNQFRQMQAAHSLGTSLHSPLSYSNSPLTEMNNDDPNFLKAQARMSQQMQRKASSSRSPMTPKTNNIHGLPMGAQDGQGFGAQPIRTTGVHDKSPSGQWMNTPTGSIPASYNSGFSSPMQPSMGQINEVMMKGGTSMPAKLGAGQNASSQEMKRKRRRESHNLVERRRRDNINERIQDLSRLVPTHRLEDEKIRKLIQNGTPLSPTLTGLGSPSQATSTLAGPGARRATGSTAGNITTGLPLEEKDKGPNKGDILNGAVSWTRDLMWMLHLKLQQQEEMMNTITELGGHFPFELTEDERRMQTELMEALSKNENGGFSYSRTAGSGLRVPHHTDYRGDPTNSTGGSVDPISLSPDENGDGIIGGDINDPDQFWHDPSDNNGQVDFKEEDEYDMDLTQ
ncbi:bHLH family transcription factor [Thelonectria olida]|uniref:BHLH family transcription factor n=1 Tax=Thelonectria olida TaxID=1576542 RepID=A0A9P8WC68_9HYPO|nr:bHLH family transcription factor [Thelonectria olida]